MKALWVSALLGIWLTSGNSFSQALSDFSPSEVVLTAKGPADKRARGGIHRAKLGESITLYAVVIGRMNGRMVAVCQADAFQRKLKIIKPSEAGGIELRWYKVEPTGDSYNNTAGGFHWDTINYREHPLGGWGQSWQIPADAHPVGGYPDAHGGAGTMAFKVVVRHRGKLYSSPGKESIFRGGLSDEVIRVTFRRDDSFVGRLTELFNTPYIWGSAGVPPPVHQAERLIGSDCADFVVYGARRLGKNLSYRGSWHLPEVCTTIAAGLEPDKQGRYLDRHKKIVAIGEAGVHIGDLLLFQGHVGALAEDHPPLGILDTNDIMIHTFWAPPALEAIRNTHYADAEVRILRWK